MRTKVLFVVFVLMSLAVVATAADEPVPIDSTLTITTVDSTSVPARDRIVAYYFHGNQRCATCYKLEEYSREALETGFATELTDSLLAWQPTNYDLDENKHYIDDYKLFTKALVLSRVRDGKEIAWRNLDKIWELVGDKKKFLAYVQLETRSFLDPESEE